MVRTIRVPRRVRHVLLLGIFALAPSMDPGAVPPARAADAPVAPAKPFPPSVYQARRAKLMKALVGGIAMLQARGEEDADGYRQDGDFYYLTGLNEPDAVLVLCPEERVYKERLFLKPRNPDAERWTGVRPDISDSLRRATGIESISRTTSLGGAMMGLLRTTKTLQLISVPGDVDGVESPEMTMYGKLSSRLPGVSIKDRTDLLPAMRSVKEPRELEEENWVAGLIDLEFKRAGAVRPGFPSIVGSGANSTILHYPEHDHTIDAGELVVVDIGSDYGRYSADITRTYPADGHFTPEQRKIYEVVLRAQQTCIDMVRPGVYMEDLQRKAEEIIRGAGYRDYFIHGLGHFVGLDVHDSGLYKKPLAAGMVITVEPGIYIPEKSLGVRIEDQVWGRADDARPVVGRRSGRARAPLFLGFLPHGIERGQARDPRMRRDDEPEEEAACEAAGVRVHVGTSQNGQIEEDEEREVDAPDFPALRVVERGSPAHEERDRAAQQPEDRSRSADAERRRAVSRVGDEGRTQSRDGVGREGPSRPRQEFHRARCREQRGQVGRQVSKPRVHEDRGNEPAVRSVLPHRVPPGCGPISELVQILGAPGGREHREDCDVDEDQDLGCGEAPFRKQDIADSGSRRCLGFGRPQNGGIGDVRRSSVHRVMRA